MDIERLAAKIEKIAAKKAIELEEIAVEQAVLDTPYCGPAPNSNRWPDLELSFPNGSPAGFHGAHVMEAFRRGWLTAERLEEPGHEIPDPHDGGVFEFHWRYRAVPAFRSIIEHRRRVRREVENG